MSSKHLPPEILDLVLDEIDTFSPLDRRKTLFSLARASWSWQERAITLLYGQVYINKSDQIPLFVRTLCNCPQLAELIRDIRVQSRDPSFQWDRIAPLPSQASANLTSLRALTFASEKLVILHNYNWDFVRSFAPCKSLRTLTIEGFGAINVPTGWMALVAAIWSMPQMTHLYMVGCAGDTFPPGGLPFTCFPERCRDLEHVQLSSRGDLVSFNMMSFIHELEPRYNSLLSLVYFLDYQEGSEREIGHTLFHQKRLQSLALYGIPVDASTEYDFLCNLVPYIRSYDIREIILGITTTVSGFIPSFEHDFTDLDTLLSEPQFAQLERVEFVNDLHTTPSLGRQHFTLEDMQGLLPSLAARDIVFVSTAPWKDGSIRQPGRFA